MNKFIGRQILRVTTGIRTHPEVTKASSETKKETFFFKFFFIKGKMRNLKLKLKRLPLWRTTNNYRISFRFSISKCQSLQKSILLRWWLRTLVCRGSGHAGRVRGHGFHIPTSVCIFSCPETIEGELGPFAPTLFNLIVKYKESFPHI